ncbi:MAG: extracellular solute-binding protein [Candidatus Kapabacteria bacterium]|nr:extracellular solute-binding protein [Candidatus Kapabacteria bacterium]
MMVFLYLVLVSGCGKGNGKQTIRLWHFWSEPAQEKALQSIIRDFEKEFPAYHVEQTPLQWSDGKTKLMMAYASQSEPDVVHLGLEWVDEFARKGVLDSVTSLLPATYHSEVLKAVQQNGTAYAVPFTMNTRALFVRKDILPIKDYQGRWQDVLVSTAAQQGAGINAYEPHNVFKKCVPFLWSYGSHIFTSVPYSQTFDEAAVRGVERYCSIAKQGIIEPSRSLDARMKTGTATLWMSGMWNLGDSSINRTYIVFGGLPTDGNMPDTITQRTKSILSADCYAINRSTTSRTGARLLISFLARASVQRTFCIAIPDAGFPVHSVSLEDAERDKELYRRTINTYFFFLQTMNSISIPASQHFDDVERIFEEEIMNAVYGKSSAASAIESARMRIRTIENTSHAATSR